MTHILVTSEMPIIAWFRSLLSKLPGKWSTIATCYVCQGFWCGLLCGYLAFPDVTLSQVFLSGCAGSFLAQLSAIYLNYLEAATLINLPEEEEEKK